MSALATLTRNIRPAAPVGAAGTPETTTTQAGTTAAPRERSLLSYIGLGLSGGLFALVLVIAAAVIVVPLVTHSTPYTVLTSSMEPTLPPGTLIVVKPIDTAAIRVGDVVTYQLNSGKAAVVTHRVTAITTTDTGARLFTLKGDNNGIADVNPVQEVQVRGKVWYSVPWIGYVNNFVNGQARSWIAPLIAGSLFLYAGYTFAASIAGARAKRRRAQAAVQAELDEKARVRAEIVVAAARLATAAAEETPNAAPRSVSASVRKAATKSAATSATKVTPKATTKSAPRTASRTASQPTSQAASRPSRSTSARGARSDA